MRDGGVQPVYAAGECEIDLARRELRIRGVPVPLGGRAFEIVEVLARFSGDLVTKDELIDRIWPGATVLENTLQVHATAIRKALGPYRGLLKTESGRGYRLLGDWAVRRHDPATPPVGLGAVRMSTNAPESNFPARVHLVGREAAIQQLRDLISAYRLVTLTGPGGIGKTTLALEVARSVLDGFEAAGRFVELGLLRDPLRLPSVVARALELKLPDEEIAAESVARAIGTQKLLLLVDNCEHVVDAAATMAETLIRLCPHVTMLATSREMLRIEGECIYRVPPLDVPADTRRERDHILGYSAVELFIARAEAQGLDSASHSDILPAIVGICRHLDGIPLAIEFAAARAAVLGVDEVAAGLRDRFTALTSGRRTAVQRHRTLQATLDWSYDLLPPDEQSLLRRLAVFPTDFTIEAVAAVMRGSGFDRAVVLYGIANLVAKSLVVLDKGDTSSRWRLLETVRAYAMAKLTLHGEFAEAARRHAAYFRDFAAPVAGSSAWRMSGIEISVKMREIDNVRAALDWAFSPQGDSDIGTELAVYCAPVWLHMSLAAECRERCEQALSAPGGDGEAGARRRVWLQGALGSALVDTEGPDERTKAALTKALETADQLNDLDTQAVALLGLTPILECRGEYGEAWAAAERFVRIADRSGDPDLHGAADRAMGMMLLDSGRLRQAQVCFERILQTQALPESQRCLDLCYLGHRAMARAMLARTLCLRGLVDQAQNEAKASLAELHDTSGQLSVCRVIAFGMSRVTLMTVDPEVANQAVVLLSEAARVANAPFWQIQGRFLEGRLLVEQRDYTRGSKVLRDAFEFCLQRDWQVSQPECKAALAEALAGLGRLDEALETVDDTLAGVGQRKTGQWWYVPELLRVKGEILLQRDTDGSPSAAEECFAQAGALSRGQGALLWELRAALNLARSRARQGCWLEARQILGPVYERFAEGLDTADLCNARALLETLPHA
jgi:predicted ATPase/DNA-binding winged helix-turn-helix (wHTH) protein